MSADKMGGFCHEDMVDFEATHKCACGCGKFYCRRCHHDHYVNDVVPKLRRKVKALQAQVRTLKARR